jgi:hypothetical protein
MNPSLNSKRSWRILSWNIRGLTLKENGMSSGVKLLNLVVTLFVYRKQKEISLALSTLEISALPHLIALNLFPRLGHLGAASSFGKLIILWVPWPSKIALDSQLNWFFVSQESTGF